MKKLLFVLFIAIAFISCEKQQEQSHILVYEMQDLTEYGTENNVVNETRLFSFRTDNDNIGYYKLKYEQPPKDVMIDGWIGTQWVEVRVYEAAPRY